MDAMLCKALIEESAKKAEDLTFFQARQAFDEMETWIVSKDALSLAEHEVENELEKQGREVCRLMLQMHLNHRGTGDVGTAVEIMSGECGVVRQKGKRTDPRQIVSIFGDVRIRRTAYMAGGHHSIHPLDDELSLPRRAASYEVQRRVVEEVVRGPYDEVVESIEKTTGARVSKRSTEEIVRDAARDFDMFYEQRGVPGAKETGPILIGAVDCKGIPMVKKEKAKQKARRTRGEKTNKKKMATVAAVFTQEARIRTPEEVVESLFEDKRPEGMPDVRPEHKRVWASLEKSKDVVIEEVAAEMAARDPDSEKLWVMVMDGERALQKRTKRFVPQALLVLDFFHVLERLWTVTHALYKEGSREATAWVRKHALMTLQGNVSQVIKGMRQSATKRNLRGKKRETIEKAAMYLYRNRPRMRYHQYLAQGLPIASGAVEGACKNLVKDRMERSGMRWTVQGAEAVLKLRALKLSRHLQEYWKFHIQQNHQLLYGSRLWRIAA